MATQDAVLFALKKLSGSNSIAIVDETSFACTLTPHETLYDELGIVSDILGKQRIDGKLWVLFETVKDDDEIVTMSENMVKQRTSGNAQHVNRKLSYDLFWSGEHVGEIRDVTVGDGSDPDNRNIVIELYDIGTYDVIVTTIQDAVPETTSTNPKKLGYYTHVDGQKIGSHGVTNLSHAVMSAVFKPTKAQQADESDDDDDESDDDE